MDGKRWTPGAKVGTSLSLTAEARAMLEQIAKRRGQSLTVTVEQLVRAEHKRAAVTK